MSIRPSRRLGECLLAALAYLAITWICLWLLKHPLADATPWVRALVALLPLVPITLAVRAVVRLILAGDELQRRIDLEAIAVAGVLVGLGALTLSLLMTADVLRLSGQQAMLWVFPALWLGYVAARVWASRRYR